MSSCPYSFTHASVAEDGTLYLTGVVLELEDRDVLHTILWERVDGQWNRYQWNNRTYDVAAYPHAGKTAAAYLGFEGTLKVRSRVAGSSVQRLETGDDAPSSLRTVGCIRRIGQSLFVVGMRRMAFRRRLEETDWTRFDGGMRQERRALEIAGLYSIDGSSEDLLIACGMNGEIWLWSSGRWTREGSPTDAWLGAARHVGEAEFVLAGAQGSVVVGTPGRWRTVPHDFKDETFSSIEVAAGRCLLAADSGRVFELTRGEHPSLTAFPVEGLTSVSSIVTAADGTYFVGRSEVRSLGPEGWRDDSPPPCADDGALVLTARLGPAPLPRLPSTGPDDRRWLGAAARAAPLLLLHSAGHSPASIGQRAAVRRHLQAGRPAGARVPPVRAHGGLVDERRVASERRPVPRERVLGSAEGGPAVTAGFGPRASGKATNPCRTCDRPCVGVGLLPRRRRSVQLSPTL